MKCYHPTGRFRWAEVVSSSWAGVPMYSARRSAVIRVLWNGGVLGTSYTTDVALMERGGMVRSYVITDSAVVPRNRKCWLESWVRPQ